jgi:hypothetical protein
MANPGQFKDFNKTANDLLTKVFPKKGGVNSWGVELELKPTKYQTLNTKINTEGGKSTGEISAEVNVTDFGLTFKGLLNTDKPKLELSAKVSDRIPVDGLSAKLHLDSSKDAQTGGVSVAFEDQYVNLNARIFIPISTNIFDFAKDVTNKDTRLEADVVLAHPDYKFVLGGSEKIVFPKNGERKFEETVVTVGYRDGKLFTPSLTYAQGIKKDAEGKEIDTKAVSVVLASQPADTQYVAKLDYDVLSKKVTVSAGLSYPLDDGATVKAKLNTDKEIGLAYSRALSSSSKLDFGSLFQVNTDEKINVNSTFNFNLKFTQ